jgi:sporulation protein YlmC with PRC-barrel domain
MITEVAAMGEAVPVTIGGRARCQDGPCGQVTRVVVDPVADEITHLVVEPEGRRGLGRLVPLDLVDASSDGITLRCTLAEFERLDPAEQTQFIPGSAGYAAYGPEQVLAWPYYGLGGESVQGDTLPSTSQTVTYDSIPMGEVEFRRGMRVRATDGAIGHVHGLVLDRRDRRVTHVLLQEGHLLARKEVAIPVSVVTGVGEDVELSIDRHQVQDLPPVDVRYLDR